MTAPVAPTPPVSSGLASNGAASPWGGSQTPWANRTRRPTAATSSASTQPAPVGGSQPLTFAGMSAAGQARPAPTFTPDPSVSQPLSLTSATQQALGGPLASRTGGPGGPTDTGGGNPIPGGGGTTGGGTTGGGITTGSTGTAFQPNDSSAGNMVFHQANIGTPAISGDLTSAVQNALQNPNPYQSPQIAAAQAAGEAQLKQQFGGEQKQLDEEMARRGIGASSIASGYQGDLAGQQATAEAGLQSNLLTNAAQLYQQGLGTALGAAGNLYGSQAMQNLGAGQLGTQQGLGAGSLALGGQQLGQNMTLGTMADTTANRGLDIQNQSNNNQLNMQVAALLASMGWPNASQNTTGTTNPVNPTPTGGGSTTTTTGGGTGGPTTPTGGDPLPPPHTTTSTGAQFQPPPGSAAPTSLPPGATLPGLTSQALGTNPLAPTGQTPSVTPTTPTGLPSQTQAALGNPAPSSVSPDVRPYYNQGTGLVSPPSQYTYNGQPITAAEKTLIDQGAQPGANAANIPGYAALMARLAPYTQAFIPGK